MTDDKTITLASGSAIRASILRNAGIPFTVKTSGVDEDKIKQAAEAGGNPNLEQLALSLAEAKALAVSKDVPGYVIGADQILEFEGNRYGKPKTLDEARERLCTFAGKSHSLINGVVVARGDQILWRNITRPILYMRDLSEDDIQLYIENVDPGVLRSVGAYEVEGKGARLFERIDGDYFAVLGLSLFPLISYLRSEGALEY